MAYEACFLAHAHLVCELLDKWDAGQLQDFGIIRAVRGTYVNIAMQGYRTAEELESFLYHRVVESELAIQFIPTIIALHPEYDSDFAHAQSHPAVVDGLQHRQQMFEKGEQERLEQMERSVVSFKSI